MDAALKLTKTEIAAFVGHQARERELAAEFQGVLHEIAARLGVIPESIGREYALDTRTWEFVAVPKQEPAPDPATAAERPKPMVG